MDGIGIGSTVTVVRAYLPYDTEYFVGKTGKVVKYLGHGIEGHAMRVEFYDEDLPPSMRRHSFPVWCLAFEREV